MNKKHIFTWGLILLVVGCLGWKNPFTNKTKEGNKLYTQEKYEEALKEYLDAQLDNPESEALHFNIGNVLFKQKKYKEAGDEYQKACQSRDVSTQAMAYYNLGNCKFRENDLPGAIEEYKKALNLNPQDQETKFNLELARRKLKEMAQQSQQNQQQCSQSQEKKKGQSSGDQQKEGGVDQNDQSAQKAQQVPQDEKEDQQARSAAAKKEKGKKEQEQENNLAQFDPNQISTSIKPDKTNKKKGQEMSEEDALRILQALQDRKDKEPKYMSPPSKGREYIEYDW